MFRQIRSRSDKVIVIPIRTSKRRQSNEQIIVRSRILS